MRKPRQKGASNGVKRRCGARSSPLKRHDRDEIATTVAIFATSFVLSQRDMPLSSGAAAGLEWLAHALLYEHLGPARVSQEMLSLKRLKFFWCKPANDAGYA
jgi:hypothetical protein